MWILSDSQCQYTSNHNQFDTSCHVMVLLICIPLSCETLKQIIVTQSRPRVLSYLS